MNDSQNIPKNQKDPLLSNCSCNQDPFAALPPDLQPKKESWKTGFRQVICPHCGKEYWTNCEDDLCIECQKK
jgi:hypothetical protein